MHATDITAEDFEGLVDREGILLIDWWAPWCAPCRAFAALFEAAAARHADLTWGRINVDAEPELAASFNIRSVPTLMVFRDGLPVLVQRGAMSAAALEELVARVRGLDMRALRSQVAARLRGVAPGRA